MSVFNSRDPFRPNGHHRPLSFRSEIWSFIPPLDVLRRLISASRLQPRDYFFGTLVEFGPARTRSSTDWSEDDLNLRFSGSFLTYNAAKRG